MSGNLARVAFANLPEWQGQDHVQALAAFRRSCREMLEHGHAFSRPVRFGGSPSSWRETCLAAFAANDAAAFFETRFRAYRVLDHERPEGLFTGYFEPVVTGSRTRSELFNVPIYRRPPDLVAFSEEEQRRSGLSVGRRVEGQPQPYFTRQDIEQGALERQSLEILWLKDWADAFFIHVQGSARVTLAEGGTVRLSYAAKSGLPYTAIGGRLVARGALAQDQMSMQSIRDWMSAHPEDARLLMWENQSFVFFREVVLEEDELGAYGAQHVQLTPRRSLAIDRALWIYGTPVWLDTVAATGRDVRMEPFRQLLIAQDTGSAIKGLARGDVYWGMGEEAARIAGPMKSPGSMTVLLPHAVADELGLAP